MVSTGNAAHRKSTYAQQPPSRAFESVRHGISVFFFAYSARLQRKLVPSKRACRLPPHSCSQPEGKRDLMVVTTVSAPLVMVVSICSENTLVSPIFLSTPSDLVVFIVSSFLALFVVARFPFAILVSHTQCCPADCCCYFPCSACEWPLVFVP